MLEPIAPVEPELVAPTSPIARAALRDYLADVASRYYGRPATESEIDAAIEQHPIHQLQSPAGHFLVAQRNGSVFGCGGVVLTAAAPAEIVRVWVSHTARGQGLGARIVTELESIARDAGAPYVRLETRADLVEARSMYLRLGYAEIPAFSAGPYSECWYGKELAAP